MVRVVMSMGPYCAPGHYHVSEFSGYLVLLKSDFTGPDRESSGLPVFPVLPVYPVIRR